MMLERKSQIQRRKVKSSSESECPQQCSCEDFYPTESGLSCVHYSVDEFGNDECHLQYDEEEWEIEEASQ